MHIKLTAERNFDWLRVAAGAFVAIGSALPIYSVAMLIDGHPNPPLAPDVGWVIILTGAYILTGLPAAVLIYLGRARRAAFVLSLLSVFVPPSLFLVAAVVAASMGGE